MEAVAAIFDKNGVIDYKQFISSLRPERENEVLNNIEHIYIITYIEHIYIITYIDTNGSFVIKHKF